MAIHKQVANCARSSREHYHTTFHDTIVGSTVTVCPYTPMNEISVHADALMPKEHMPTIVNEVTRKLIERKIKDYDVALTKVRAAWLRRQADHEIARHESISKSRELEDAINELKRLL